MTDLPVPRPGLVIRYSYLWKREHDAGRVEGAKDRPCAIVVALKPDGDDTQVVVAPITHTEPVDDHAVKLSSRTSQRLQLDEDTSWVITSEVNVFHWPGPDLRQTDTGEYSYGLLPAVVFEEVRTKLLSETKQVPRTG